MDWGTKPIISFPNHPSRAFQVCIDRGDNCTWKHLGFSLQNSLRTLSLCGSVFFVYPVLKRSKSVFGNGRLCGLMCVWHHIISTGRRFKILPRQKNLWVNFGSGKFPSVWYKATSKLRKVRNPYPFPVVTFALLFKPSTCIPSFSFLMVCSAELHQFKRRWDAFVSPLPLSFTY